MNRVIINMVLFGVLVAAPYLKAAPLFEDPFDRELKEGWSWIREDPKGWKVADGVLQIRVQPGNMWGPANDAKNVLVRPLPEVNGGEIVMTTRVENHPTEQYEQVDLVWYYDDSHMVKIGQEQVDGQLSVVMGREESDRTRTINIIPIEQNRVHLRLVKEGQAIEGFYQTSETEGWKKAGECDLPAKEEPHVSIQTYQGPKETVHWARIESIRLEHDQQSRAVDSDKK